MGLSWPHEMKKPIPKGISQRRFIKQQQILQQCHTWFGPGSLVR